MEAMGRDSMDNPPRHDPQPRIVLKGRFGSHALRGQAQAIGDSVNAVFDDVLVQQVPEPSSQATLCAIGVIFAALRRKPVASRSAAEARNTTRF